MRPTWKYYCVKKKGKKEYYLGKSITDLHRKLKLKKDTEITESWSGKALYKVSDRKYQEKAREYLDKGFALLKREREEEVKKESEPGRPISFGPGAYLLPEQT
jgi:hypothetical protein